MADRESLQKRYISLLQEICKFHIFEYFEVIYIKILNFSYSLSSVIYHHIVLGRLFFSLKCILLTEVPGRKPG